MGPARLAVQIGPAKGRRMVGAIAIVDSGSSASVVSFQVCKAIGAPVRELFNGTTLTGFGGTDAVTPRGTSRLTIRAFADFDKETITFHGARRPAKMSLQREDGLKFSFPLVTAERVTIKADQVGDYRIKVTFPRAMALFPLNKEGST
ncbi:hypothetical protein BC831DRAFT_518165 [Entophlyctis helioformis]|nr:hypothetical protein BC831DRAFT_518165 [Entophlyctis helioformis]